MLIKWRILIIIIFIYLPVSLDATILYVVAPVLSTQLKTTYTELLWIMDIYPIVMAALLIPMGALGDRLGFRKMAYLGSALFGVASVGTALADTPLQLISARALLAVGAAVIVPATLSAVRIYYPVEKDRNVALGIWTTIGTGGALAGPLLGGMLLEKFYWGSVFLINIPVVLVVFMLLRKVAPNAQRESKQPLNLSQSLLLMSGLLLLIYAFKGLARQESMTVMYIYISLVAIVLLGLFIILQLVLRTPLLDMGLIKQRNVIAGLILALTSMISLVGFELVISQELQFVHQFTPIEVGIYVLPLMLACCLTGPFAGYLINRFGVKIIATAGLGVSACCLYALSGIDFVKESFNAKIWMFLLGISDTAALMASSSAIMTAAPENKASIAGSIEGMSYELGTGLGITIFGSVLASIYSTSFRLPEIFSETISLTAGTSFSEAVTISEQLDEPARTALRNAASSAFIHSHSITLQSAALILVLLMMLTLFIFKHKCVSGY
ncbi:MFS transporter [Yokenella regensburgei]|uniref:MFS transporter n=1 Tax=Yokenella regensburgei TaxID=158877 RepID=UPI003F13761B